MGVDYDFCTGQISEVESELVKAFECYARHNEYIKVGITCDPEEKELEHIQKEKWDRMVVVFEANSYDGAKEVETKLFEYAHVSKHFEKIWNVLYRGENHASKTSEKYYVYFLIDNDCKTKGAFRQEIS